MIIIYKSDSKNRCRYPVSTFFEQCSLLEFGTLNFDSLPKATWSVTFGLKPCYTCSQFRFYLIIITTIFRIYLFIRPLFYTYFCLYYFSYLLNYIIIVIFTLTFVIPFLIIIIFVIHFLNYHYIIIFYTYFCSTISRQRRSTSACHPCVKRTFLNFDLRNVCLL